VQPNGSTYPAALQIERPGDLERWRPFVQWLLAIPHWLIVYVLGLVSSIVALVSWLVVLFTGSLPEGLATFQCLYLRYGNRTVAYSGFTHDRYPPFAFDTVAADPGDNPPVRTDLTPALEGRNRLTVFFRWLLALPHAIVLGVIGIAVPLALLAAAVAVLFTGRWPDGLFGFVVGYLRWTLRFNAYNLLLTDEYPPFSFD
jgi:hypothetical protein